MKKAVNTKTVCINPNTGREMLIDTSIYELFSKAIYHALKSKQPLTYSALMQEVKRCFQEQKTAFEGSIEWYGVSVKGDMEVKGIIESFTEKGRKFHRLKNKSHPAGWL